MLRIWLVNPPGGMLGGFLFDGLPSVLIPVFRVGDPNALEISKAVHQFVEAKKARLPEGLSISAWHDDAAYLRSRQQLLVKNGFVGLLLVFLSLALFLRINLAVWVSFGLAKNALQNRFSDI